MSNLHPSAQLSAYLDDALSAVERSAVGAHLDSCGDCRRRLSELRTTASLMRALPDLAPSRRLVPRLSAPPMWLAPLRTLTTLASGVTAFLFIASTLLASANGLAGTPTSLNAPAASAGAAGAATAGERADSGATSQPPGAPNVAGPGEAPSASRSAQDAVKAATPTAGPTQDTTTQFSAVSAAPQDA